MMFKEGDIVVRNIHKSMESYYKDWWKIQKRVHGYADHTKFKVNRITSMSIILSAIDDEREFLAWPANWCYCPPEKDLEDYM